MDDRTKDIYDPSTVTEVKKQLNKILWSYAPDDLTLRQAEDIATKCLHLIFRDLV